MMRVLIAFARREQGLLVAAGNPMRLGDIASVAEQRARLAVRPAGAGAQLLLLALAARAGIAVETLALQKPACPTGADIAQAVRAGRADCGIATRAVAQAAGLGFVPLAWERFDLALRQRSYFLPGLQILFKFMRTAAFHERAAELAGYDLSETGDVRLRQLRRRMAPKALGLSLPGRGLYCRRRNILGGMAEWLKAHAWKACIRETVSWVRIPLPPPDVAVGMIRSQPVTAAAAAIAVTGAATVAVTGAATVAGAWFFQYGPAIAASGRGGTKICKS